MRLTRRAGSQHASRAAAATTSGAARNVRPSSWPMPKRRLSRRRVAAAAAEPAPAPLAPGLRRWGAGCAAVYLTLAATHSLLFGSAPGGALLLAVAAVSAAWLVRSLTRNGSAGV